MLISDMACARTHPTGTCTPLSAPLHFSQLLPNRTTSPRRTPLPQCPRILPHPGTVLWHATGSTRLADRSPQPSLGHTHLRFLLIGPTERICSLGSSTKALAILVC